MDKFVIKGGNKLYGEVEVQGAKNAILPIFAAAILTDSEVVIKNVPSLIDVKNMANILKNLGVAIKIENNVAVICAKDMNSFEIPTKLAKELRSSIFLLGSILARQKYAKVAYPGGCDIGLRPIDIHIKGLEDLQVRIIEKSGYIYCDATKLCGGVVNLDYPSVGATENVMLASVLAEGVTTINNAACEPEIVDLQNFLLAMGAKIKGAGTNTITINGVKSLHGAEYTAMPDRIVAGTYAIATAMTGGQIKLLNARYGDLQALFSKLNKSSCNICVKNDIISITAKPKRIAVGDITTRPYPGFATDLQAQMMALLSISEGTSVINENIFENRFRHVSELKKMGGDIVIHGKTAVIRGVERLFGAEVVAQDLRGGAALILAGLCACGTTTVLDAHHIDRGYENIEKTLRQIGADVRRT